MKTLFLVMLTIILLSSQCQHVRKSDHEHKKGETIKAGIIYNGIKCLNYNLQYCLYIPETADEKKLPVLICFDPSGKGQLPVEKYKLLSEKYGIILVGMNDTKNGMAWEEVQTIALSVIEDCKSRYPVDLQRIYLAGFSGGARYAFALALTNPDICGVIACGAGLPAVNQQANRSFAWVGIAGLSDFNYSEMRNVEESLKATPIHHIFIEFDGEHSWPPVNIFEKGIYFFEFEAIKNKFTSKDTLLINSFTRESIKEIDSLLLHQQYLFALRDCSNSMEMLEGLGDVSIFRQKSKDIQSHSSFIMQFELEKKVLEKENMLIQNYLQMLGQQTLDWWKTEINRLWGKTKSNNFLEARSFQRILNYISLACFIQCSQNFRKNDAAFHYFLPLYEWVDPDNPDVYYFKALDFIEKKQNNLALKALQECVKFGFNDKEKLLREEAFISLHGEKQWAELINSIK